MTLGVGGQIGEVEAAVGETRAMQRERGVQFARRLGREVGDDDVEACIGERRRAGEPDAARSARDDGDGAGHGLTLPLAGEGRDPGRVISAAAWGWKAGRRSPPPRLAIPSPAELLA